MPLCKPLYMYVCMYTYICIHVDISMHIYISMHIHVDIYRYIYRCILSAAQAPVYRLLEDTAPVPADASDLTSSARKRQSDGAASGGVCGKPIVGIELEAIVAYVQSQARASRRGRCCCTRVPHGLSDWAQRAL
jgi:hypothetical protein